MDLGPDDKITASAVPDLPRPPPTVRARGFLVQLVLTAFSLAILLAMIWHGITQASEASEENGAQLTALRAEVRRTTEEVEALRRDLARRH